MNDINESAVRKIESHFKFDVESFHDERPTCHFTFYSTQFTIQALTNRYGSPTTKLSLQNRTEYLFPFRIANNETVELWTILKHSNQNDVMAM